MTIITGNTCFDIVLTIITLIYIVHKYFNSNFDYWKKRGVEYLTPIPFFGNFKDVVTLKMPIGHFLAKLYNQTNYDYFGIWVFGTPHMIIRSPDLIKKILVKDFNYFSDRNIIDDEKADPIASKVLFRMKNPKWKVMRSKISPIFTSGKIKMMIPLMNDAAEEMTSYLNKITLEESSIDAKEICAKFTTDIITSCAFGVNAGSFKNENAIFRDIGRKMFGGNLWNAFRQISYFFAPTIIKLFRLSFYTPEVNQFCRTAILHTIKERETSGIRRKDLIDIIIDLKRAGIFDGIDKNEETIVAQGLQFFAAGFETTSSTIAFTLYEMCMNPDVQTKLRKNIISTLNKHGNITYELINSIKYLDQVIQETLRKYPVLSFLDRRCLANYQIPDTNTIIEKGTPVFIPMLGLHYDPKYFPDPEKFDPERFSEAAKKTRPAYSYIPFGDGPHNCIGQRFGLIVSKLGIIHIILNFCVERSEDTPVSITFDPKSFVLQSLCDLRIRFTRFEKID